MSFFEVDDYKKIVNDWLAKMPKRGHGQFRKLAGHLGVNSTMVSQIFRGHRDLNSDQALMVAEYMALPPIEQEYFVFLVLRERAGTQHLREFYNLRLRDIRSKASDTKARITDHQELSEMEKAVFYSEWSYSAARLLPSIHGLESLPAIAARLGLPLEKIQSIVQFLLANGLLQSENGRLQRGPATTFLGKDSKFVNNHHRNWRLKAMERSDQLAANDYMFSSLTALSKKDLLEIRNLLVDTVSKVYERVKPSHEETLAFLNIDWIEI